jgi:hypothetical protein
MSSDHANPGTTNPADQSYPAVPHTRVAESTGRGLAANVDAGSANHAKFMSPVEAPATPPAGKLVHAAGGKPGGGLAINVNIK